MIESDFSAGIKAGIRLERDFIMKMIEDHKGIDLTPEDIWDELKYRDRRDSQLAVDKVMELWKNNKATKTSSTI
jgi:hypothetical protein